MSQTQSAQPKSGASEMKVHLGNLIMLAANQYPTLLASLLEIVQNAIDGEAKHIQIKLDRKSRNLFVFDNGNGASVTKFEQALGQIGQSMKALTKLGRFGYGLVSPIDKCEAVTFTSCPKEMSDLYMMWTFRADEIRNRPETIHIPHTPQSFRFGRTTKTLTIDSKTVSQVEWRTRVMLRNYTPDREIAKIGTIDDLAKEIFSRYGTAMRAGKVRLSIEYTDDLGKTEVRRELTAPEYTGESLMLHSEVVGGTRATFKLFLARAEGRRGKSNGLVVVGESDNPFRFPIKELIIRCGEYINPEVARALRSGIFEGEITSGSAKLHENRKQFVINDGLINFAQALEQWYTKVGAHHMETIQESRAGERYQELGLESMKNIEQMLNTAKFSHLVDLLKLLPHGTVGKQHQNNETVVGQQEHRSKRTGEGGQKTSTKNGEGGPTKEPKEQHPKDTPYTVAGPEGQRRHIVGGGSFGLQFSYQNMPGENRLWIFDDTQGILHFNVRHPVWVACDTSNKRVMQLQELVAVQAINWFFAPDYMKDNLLEHTSNIIDQHAFMLVHSASFNSGAPKKIEEE